MDQNRTQKMLDALANMFLTDADEVEAGGKAQRPVGEESGQDVSDDVSSSENRANQSPSHDFFHNDHELKAPEPIRLEPKTRLGLATSTTAPPTSLPATSPVADTNTEQIDSVASFAHEQLSPVASSNATPCCVEAVFLANLPGFSGPWLTQYARSRAESSRPVAILHMVEEQRIDLELVTLAPPTGVADEPPVQLTQGSLLDVIATLSDTDGVSVGCWLVHLSPPPSPQSLKFATALDSWTMLCGADDAAVVDAYRILKQLSEGAKPGRDLSQSRRVQLMVMGSGEDRSHVAARKIRSASASFLHTPVDLLGHQKQMVPVAVQILGSFTVEQNEDRGGDVAMQVLAALVELVTPSAKNERLRMWPEPGTLEREQPEPGARTFAQEANGSEQLSEHDAVLSIVDAESSSGSHHELDERTIAQPLAATRGMEQCEDSAEDPNLVSFLAGVGAIALDARGPRFPNTQLALDRNGRVHLLRQHRAVDEQLRAALMDLIESRQWVCEHLDLIRLTQRQCRFDDHAEPELHLFTDDAKSAVAIVGRLGSVVKLHLLEQVKVSNSATWYCTELN